MLIGVLALQGDFEAHQRALETAGAATRQVRTPRDLDGVDRLVIPGGESTTMGKLAAQYGLLEPIRKRAIDGMPVFGTCAGMILCARGITGGVSCEEQPLLGIADVRVRRNAFGRQIDSFECDLDVGGVVGGAVHAVFIRAPFIEEVGPGVEILAEHNGWPVAARDGSTLLCSFHPELTGDARMHSMFLEM